MPEGQGQGVPEVPPQFRRQDPAALTRVTLDGAPPVGGAVDQGVVFPTGVTPDEDIVWTDPDNPDAPLPGLEETLSSAGSQRGPWEVSHTEARRAAVRQGKPLLIWFTDTKRSPTCQTLSRELFSTPDFDAWANGNVVRLRLDYNVSGAGGGYDDKMDDRLRKKAYLESLKKRYNAGGFPTVLVMAPDGTVTGRYRGYRRGAPDFYWGRLKNAVRTAVEQQEDWLERMTKKGYRTWTDRKGRTLFAKLLRYYESGEMILVEPDGRRLRAKEKSLSDADRRWIAGERAKRRP